MSTRTRTTYRAITAGALLGASSPAALVCAAPYEAPGDLTGDVPVSGLSLFGVDPRAEFGRAAASAGDINGDGFDDIIVGAPFGDPGCRDDAGQAFVVFGGPDVDANGNLLSLEFFDTIAGVRINGAFPGDLLGFELAGGGDLNGDGIDDIALTAPFAQADGEAEVGAVVVLFGRLDRDTSRDIEVSSLDASDGFVLIGDGPAARFFGDISIASDLNNDGFDDLFVGSEHLQRLYVIYGSPTLGAAAPVELAALAMDSGFVVDEPRNQSSGNSVGLAVAPAGDMNHDGIDDLVFSGHAVSSNGTRERVSYLLFGAEGNLSGTFTLSDLVSQGLGVAVTGPGGDPYPSAGATGAGDFNHDGFDDLALGNSGAAPNGDTRAGEVFVRFGPITRTPEPARGVAFEGESPFDYAGVDVAGPGDINADGIDDLLIGTLENSLGILYAVFGAEQLGDGARVGLGTLDPTQGYPLRGRSGRRVVGRPVAAAGDLDADGIDDLLIGVSEAYSYAFNFRNSLPHCDGSELRLGPLSVNRLGEAHVIFGAPSPCNAADLDTPFGVLDLADLQAFTDAFLAGAPAADLDASGVVDLADIALFVSGFLAGCP